MELSHDDNCSNRFPIVTFVRFDTKISVQVVQSCTAKVDPTGLAISVEIKQDVRRLQAGQPMRNDTHMRIADY